MLQSTAPIQDGVNSHSHSPEQRGRRGLFPTTAERTADGLLLPKNRSTGNLLQHAVRSAETDRARIRFSFDAGVPEHDALTRASLMTEHDHGLGLSGLRRIRQHPPPRINTISSSNSSRAPSVGPRSASMNITLPSESRKSSNGAMSTCPSSPTLNFTEDLSRFPSESLHSFSFAHQAAEESIHNRQNVLKRSLEFMSKSINRHGSSQAAIASAQARVAGDHETQNMLELLARARLVGPDAAVDTNGFGLIQGPVTSPAQFSPDNVFDKSYGEHRSASPEPIVPVSPTQVRVSQGEQPVKDPKQEPDSSATGKDANDLAATEGKADMLSRSTTRESMASATHLSPVTTRPGIQRTLTDTASLKLQNTLIDAMVQPYPANDKYANGKMLSPTMPQGVFPFSPSQVMPTYADSASAQLSNGSASYGVSGPHPPGPVVHGHSSRWAPAAQAIFTTESKAPWTILAANDLACLVFGVTNAEVRRMGIMEVVRDERRTWLEEKLAQPGSEADHKSKQETDASNRQATPRSTTSFLLGRGGITASLLSKPSSRQVKESRRTQTDGGAGTSIVDKQKAVKGSLHHPGNKSRGVLLCGDVVPIQKRNGHTGSASLWVKEKKGGLIWVLEEIHEDVALIRLDGDGIVKGLEGSTGPIWGESVAAAGVDIGRLVPRIPRQGIDPRCGELDYAEVVRQRYFTARNHNRANVPITVERVPGALDLRVSSFPHIAGIVVLAADTLQITSANSVFSSALFGQERPDRLHITDLIPGFDRILKILTEEDGIQLVDGIVVPEHSFRRARAFGALRDGKADAAAYFLRPDGIPAKHRDGSEIKIDLQMRVVKSDKHAANAEHVILEEDEEDLPQTEVVYALWITYSRHLHAGHQVPGAGTPLMSGSATPLHQPSPGQTQIPTPVDMDSSDEPAKEVSHATLLTRQLKEAARKTTNIIVRSVGQNEKLKAQPVPEAVVAEVSKKTIDDFAILEEMGQGAYGQVKLARNKNTGEKVVLKFVTKRRILVDTWTRDRRLGTVPLEIHVLDYLSRNGLQHPNIVEMNDFFEDDVNYYIEMIPHGLPGMDLFDYIELRVNMEEAECCGIFVQVARAVHHLHTKANVVHRDIKDENVVLDGEGTIKLIDFGSAAYIKSGPFDVFVGTIDYAAPEVLAGKPYRGKEQDVWALGILLYTIIYKENPFYSIDEIMDRDLRVPYIMSEASIDLIRKMLDRDLDRRIDIQQVLDHPWLKDEMAENREWVRQPSV